MRRRRDDSSINSIVGPGTYVRGHMQITGLLRIDGDFSGSVRADGRVIVGRGGRADCVIEAQTVVIGGIFRGDVRAAQKVVVLSSAVIFGNIYAPRLVIEEGVLLNGEFGVSGPGGAAPPHSDRVDKELLVETVNQRETVREQAARQAEPVTVPEDSQWSG